MKSQFNPFDPIVETVFAGEIKGELIGFEYNFNLLALRIRNLIAAREFNTAEANRELERGHWQYDHGRRDRELEAEISELFERVKPT